MGMTNTPLIRTPLEVIGKAKTIRERRDMPETLGYVVSLALDVLEIVLRGVPEGEDPRRADELVGLALTDSKTREIVARLVADRNSWWGRVAYEEGRARALEATLARVVEVVGEGRETVHPMGVAAARSVLGATDV